MKGLTFRVIFLCLIAQFAWGQPADTLTYATGKVTSAVTDEPVVARIFYQSLPYGSKIGTVNGSEFRFPLFDNEKYSITVEAPGFAPSKYMIDPADANENREVVRDIELGLPSSAAEVAKSTHTPGKIMLLDNLIFQQGRARISAESHAELDSVVAMLNDNPNMIIQLEGHTDYLGDPRQNMKLSQERVDAVRDYLVSKGISKRKVKTKAFGGTTPLSTENTDVAHKLNRRVELRILSN